MQQQFYERVAEPFRKDEKKKRILLTTNEWITKLFYVMYPVLLLYLVICRDRRILLAILVPGISFVAVTLVRKAISASRPYELWDMKPLIEKDTVGKSFPSRHVFSVYIIGMAWLWIVPVVGVILMAVGVFLAIARVIGGVHFVKDVIAGAAIGIVVGWICFFVMVG